MRTHDRDVDVGEYCPYCGNTTFTIKRKAAHPHAYRVLYRCDCCGGHSEIGQLCTAPPERKSEMLRKYEHIIAALRANGITLDDGMEVGSA